jgi:hypothetical protein
MTSRDANYLLQQVTRLAYGWFVSALLPFHTAEVTGSSPVPPTNQRTSRRPFDRESYLPDHVDRLMTVSAPDAVCAEVRFIKSKDLASLQGFSGRDHRGVR